MTFKILVVDDESDLEVLITTKFRSRIHTGELGFVFALNGAIALEKLKTNTDINLVLSDINMPVMDGLTLLSKIKKEGFIQKTVIISAYGDIHNIRSAMNLGAFDFIMKPIDLKDLEITLEKSIEETLKIHETIELKIKLENERMEKEALILNHSKILELRVEERTEQLRIEKQKSDDLLLNILPLEIAEEIKLYGKSKAKTYSMVTVMFTDFVDFTRVSEKFSAELLVAEIDHCFSAFDEIIHKYKIEKIKTVGDAYICVGGMPVLTYTHATDIVRAAIEINEFMLLRKLEKEARREIPFQLRIGIHTGPLVAGIVGIKKFAFDIWGDTVNIAARMESSGEAGMINISETTKELVKDNFLCIARGKMEAKNKGELEMYFVEKEISA